MHSAWFSAVKRGVLLALALSTLALSTLALSMSPAWAAGPDSPTGRAELAAMTVADLEKGLLSSPGAGTIAAVKANYPGEYPLLLQEMLGRIKASDGSFAASHLIGAEVMRAFMMRHGPELINAPSALLNRINARQLALMRGLAGGQVALCAEYATTGFTGRTPLPEPYLSQASALSVMFIEASRAGADRPREAGRGTLRDEDALAWYDSVHRIGTSQDVLDAMSKGESGPPPSQDVSCRMGIAVYAAIDTLPAEQAGRVAAFFLQEGMKTQSAQ
jgi:hypothetical protein